MIFDLNIRIKRWSKKKLFLYLNKVLPTIDILFASGEDFIYWKGNGNVNNFEKVLNKYKIPHGIYRKNSRINYSFCNSKKYIIKNNLIKKILDSSGAGDGYNAAYLSNFLENHDPKKALENAAKIGAKIVMKKGAITDVR